MFTQFEPMITIRTGHNLPSNEYEQFVRYENFTRHYYLDHFTFSECHLVDHLNGDLRECNLQSMQVKNLFPPICLDSSCSTAEDTVPPINTIVSYEECGLL